jgi:hypothetical protein
VTTPFPRIPRTSLFRSASLLLGLTGAAATFVACSGDVTSQSSGSGGAGGAATSGPDTTTTTLGTGGSSTTTETTTTETTGSQGGGGTGGAATGGGGAGGVVDPWAGPIEALKPADLGDVVFGASTPFAIPDKTLGFTVQIEGGQLTDVVGVYRLRPPTGGSVIINFSMAGHQTQLFGGQGFIGASDPQADSADAYPVKDGTWKLTLGSDGASGDKAHARVWARRTNDGAFHGGVLDVNLIIVPGAASASYMNQVLAAFFPYAGIEKGAVDTYQASSSFSTINSVDEYREMLATSAAVPNAPAVNLFVVDDFADSAYGGAIGVSGGIPGSPMRHGTVQSGLAYEPSGDPNYDATVLMHEIGHLGGLFHTTEFAIAETDPLGDTPECPAATIASKPDTCADKDNVMFPIAYGATAFSAGQLNVLHGSALYRGILEAGGAPPPPLLLGAVGPALLPFVDDASPAQVVAMPRLPDALERALGALWCSGGLARSALSVARDANALLSRHTAKSASARLRAIAFDTASPVLLRKRALRLYAQAARAEGHEAEAMETLLAVARRKGAVTIAERRFQAAALRLVAGARAAAAPSVAPRIDQAIAAALASNDRLLSAVAAGH